MRRRITITAIAVFAGALTPTVVSGHCYSGQKCEPDPLNLHHGGLAQATPQVRELVGALENMNQAPTQETLRRIILVPIIKAPVHPGTDLPRLPKLDLPPGGIRVDEKAGSRDIAGQLKPNLKNSASRPLTPAEFARQALPIRDAEDVKTVIRGVADVYRALRNASAIERLAKEDPQASSGRMTSLNLNIASAALEKLKAYDRVLKDARRRAERGDLRLSREVLTDLERIYRGTQSIIQLRE